MDGGLRSWSCDPALIGAMVLLGIVYLRGFVGLCRRDPRRLPAWRGAAYLAGLAVIFVALESPLDAFAPLLLSAHMGQHLLLTMVAPPLVLLGAPFAPLIRGMPRILRHDALGPFLADRRLRRAARWCVHPAIAWSLFTFAILAWHTPALYQLALKDPAWHRVEHASFLLGAILFWWPVLQPWPSRLVWPRWAMVPYLLAADLVNTGIAALFAFSSSLVYPAYRDASAAIGVDAVRDQALAGALMWIPGSIAYLAPAIAILLSQMRPKSLRRATPEYRATRRPPTTGGHPRRRFDLLQAPWIGAIIRRRAGRLVARGVMLLLAAAICLDGFLGPSAAPMNLAGTLPWTHWRGAAVLLLLVGGNFLCMTCPFILPRLLARRWRGGTARRAWPAALRSKWLAAGLVAAWLILYEAFDLWASPWATAMVIVGYFVAAAAVDAIAHGGAFCKWVCPLGQFHFVQSTLSPLQVAALSPDVCRSCTTHDCLRGNDRVNGCELELSLPAKEGNLDCTFCLDCADACPHGNVGIIPITIGGELRDDRWRSSLGRLSGRADLASLALVLSGGAIANAAGMVAPVLEVQARVAEALGTTRSVAAGAAVAIVMAAPLVGAMMAATVRRLVWGSSWRRSFTDCAFAAVPIGVAMWLAHFGFHLATGWGTAPPVAVRALHDLGVTSAEPSWSASCCEAAPQWILPTQLMVLSLGLTLALWTAWRRANAPSNERGVQWRGPLTPPSLAWLPSALLLVAMWAAAAWVLFQPMEMRGMLP